MSPITGYPDFARLEDQEVARQLKLVWDALIGLSSDVAALPATDLSSLETSLSDEQRRRQALERRVILLEKPPGIHRARTSDQTITTAKWTEILFEVSQHVDGLIEETDRITFQRLAPHAVPGRYIVGASVIFEANVVGHRVALIEINNDGGVPAGQKILCQDAWIADHGGTNSAPRLVVIGERRFTEGDYVQLKVYQSSGGDLDVVGAGRLDSPRLWATRIGD